MKQLVTAALMLFVSSSLLAQKAGESVMVQGDIQEDVYVAGERVRVIADVTGDVLVAGGHVKIEKTVSGDVMAAGGSVRISATVGDDVRAAGGDVQLDAVIAGDAVAAGGSVSVTSDSRIGGRGWFAGGNIEISGIINKELKVAGGHIALAGEVNGDVDLVAQSIEILPTAVIRGNLDYRSPDEARIDEGARITGTITHLPGYQKDRASFGERLGGLLFLLLVLFVSGSIIYLLFPRLSLATAETIVSRPFASIGLGLLVLLTIPPLVLLLMITVLAMPLAFMLFAAYPLLLILGMLIGLFFTGYKGLMSTTSVQPTQRLYLLAYAIALVLFGLLTVVPFVGGLVFLVILLLGVGGLTLMLVRGYHQAEP